MALLITALGGTFMIEQPGSSLMRYYFRMQWLFRQLPASWLFYYVGSFVLLCQHEDIHIAFWVRLSKVYRIGWWMAHYGAQSAKRHQGFTNNKWAEMYNRGKLLPHQRPRAPDFRPVRYTRDRNGNKRWHGTKHLKQTQPGTRDVCKYGVCVCVCVSVCVCVCGRVCVCVCVRVQMEMILEAKGISCAVWAAYSPTSAKVDDPWRRKAFVRLLNVRPCSLCKHAVAGLARGQIAGSRHVFAWKQIIGVGHRVALCFSHSLVSFSHSSCQFQCNVCAEAFANTRILRSESGFGGL